MGSLFGESGRQDRRKAGAIRPGDYRALLPKLDEGASPVCSSRLSQSFHHPIRGTLTPNTFLQSFAENLKRTGLNKILGEDTISCHTVRHYFCTMYLVNGGTLHGLQRITGHKNIETEADFKSLCMLFGVGLVLFDLNSNSPLLLNSGLEPSVYSPDMFYVNEFADRLKHYGVRTAFEELFG